MTTESKQGIRSRSGFTLLGAAISAAVAGLVVSGIGALSAGSAAAYGALVGTTICVAIFAFGAFSVDAVARVMPAASLMFALLTYTMQVALMALALVVLTRSGALGTSLDRRWLAGAIIAGTFAWLVAQVWLATQSRIPAFDEQGQDPSVKPAADPDAGAR